MMMMMPILRTHPRLPMIPILRHHPMALSVGTLRQSAGDYGLFPLVSETIWSAVGGDERIAALAGEHGQSHAIAGGQYE